MSPPFSATAPGFAPPPGTADCHMHVVGPPGRLPLAEWVAESFADPATRAQVLRRNPERLDGFATTGP